MAHVDLRCKSKKHGEILEGDLIEIKCNSRFCGSGNGVIVLHTFHARTGELVSTEKYRDIRS